MASFNGAKRRPNLTKGIDMSSAVTFQGNPITVLGDLPQKGDAAPDFELVNADLGSVSLKDFAGKRKVLSIFPSIDTGVCQAQARRFNEEADKLDNTVTLCISKDLPFAQGRFCAAEGLRNIVTLSNFRGSDFGQDYGVEIADGPMKGLFARGVVVLDENNVTLYASLAPEITQEPDYAAALETLKR